MKFLLGEKLEMSQMFSPQGEVIPFTKVLAGPCRVVQFKTEEKDGYTAVVLGFGFKKRVKKAQKYLGNHQYLKEFRVAPLPPELKVGQEITVNDFQEGEKVKVVGWSKGRGFQGVVKRHGFAGSPASHGHKDQLRMPGSIGATGPQRVIKGRRMPGRMGGERQTLTALEIVGKEPKKNILWVKGAIPGSRHRLLLLAAAGGLSLTEAKAKTVKS